MPEESLTRRANHRHIATIAGIIRLAPVSVAGFFVPASVQLVWIANRRSHHISLTRMSAFADSSLCSYDRIRRLTRRANHRQSSIIETCIDRPARRNPSRVFSSLAFRIGRRPRVMAPHSLAGLSGRCSRAAVRTSTFESIRYWPRTRERAGPRRGLELAPPRSREG
jgi:hypothetical protein